MGCSICGADADGDIQCDSCGAIFCKEHEEDRLSDNTGFEDEEGHECDG